MLKKKIEINEEKFPCLPFSRYDEAFGSGPAVKFFIGLLEITIVSQSTFFVSRMNLRRI